MEKHYEEFFAAIVKYKFIRILLAIIASHELKLGLINFVGAYLHAKPQGENYLKIPEGFEDYYKIPDIDTVLKMNYTIYRIMNSRNN